jgi:hypothetical protein
MFVNDEKGIIISVPMKCGTETFATALPKDWIDIYANPKFDEIPLSALEKTLKVCELTNRNLNDYTHYVIVRHPVKWLVSGFRFLQSLQKNPKHFKYHTNFEKHLHDVYLERTQNYQAFDGFWSDHCSVMPDQYCDENAIPIKLENIDEFFKTFDIYNIPLLNKTSSRIPYPRLNTLSKDLLYKISADYCKRFHYVMDI